MNEQFSALIAALADNEEFRSAFLAAKDAAGRIATAKEAGLEVPGEEAIAAVTQSLEAGEGIPDAHMSAAFWFSA